MRSNRAGKKIVQRRTDSAEQKVYSMTLREGFNYFVGVKRSENVRDRTVKDYHEVMGEFFAWIGDDSRQAGEITAVDIREFIVFLQSKTNKKTCEQGLAPTTVNVRLRVLKTFFRLLFREQMIDSNPTATVRLLRVDEKPFQLLTDGELDRLTHAMDKRQFADFRDYAMTQVIMDTGIRIKELCALEISDLNLPIRLITLPGSKSKNRRVRALPIANTTARILSQLIAENAVNWPDQMFIFLSGFGEPYNTNSFRGRLNIYKKRAAIEKPVSPHLLRHKFCTDYMLNGGDVFSLSQLVGHENIQTTKRYVNMTIDDITKQHELFSPAIRMRTRSAQRYTKGGASR